MPAPSPAHPLDSHENRTVPEIEQPFVGRWNDLVSRTNWDKGRIIQEWREALMQLGTSAAEYSDEVWSQRVGGVTSQHVGRLRRVYQRFGDSYAGYPGLFWSHFQAAVDWDDAEMWLEGASQNRWCVAEMRGQRAETLGALAADHASGDGSSPADIDEDVDSSLDSGAPAGRDDMKPGAVEQGRGSEALADGPAQSPGQAGMEEDVAPPARDGAEDRVQQIPVRPFENLGDLPPDLADAMDAFKLAILRHKAEGWRQIECAGILGILDALRQLVLAPAENALPF